MLAGRSIIHFLPYSLTLDDILEIIFEEYEDCWVYENFTVELDYTSYFFRTIIREKQMLICCVEAAASPILAVPERLARLTTYPKRDNPGSTKSRRRRVLLGTMDAAEYEGDVQLQKAASGLLADFDASLQPFLWRTLDSGKPRIRRRVRVREKDRLLRLVC